MSKVRFFAFCVLSAFVWAVAYGLLYMMGVTGNLWIIMVPVVISPVGMVLVRKLLEPGGPPGILKPTTQSWAFLFGDLFVLPFVFAMLALGWRKLDEGWYDQAWWFWLALVVGIGIACGWHFVLETPGYTERGYADLLASPSKLWHDFVVYGSLSAGLVYLGVPVLVNDLKGYGALALLGLGVWGLLGLADNTIHTLDPRDLHPPVSSTRIA